MRTRSRCFGVATSGRCCVFLRLGDGSLGADDALLGLQHLGACFSLVTQAGVVCFACGLPVVGACDFAVALGSVNGDAVWLVRGVGVAELLCCRVEPCLVQSASVFVLGGCDDRFFEGGVGVGDELVEPRGCLASDGRCRTWQCRSVLLGELVALADGGDVGAVPGEDRFEDVAGFGWVVGFGDDEGEVPFVASCHRHVEPSS